MGKLRPTPTSVDEFALSGPSNPPDPAFNAYRKDLADIALAGKVIASHYASSVDYVLGSSAKLRAAPQQDAEILLEMKAGASFAMLDDSLGWAWGYAGKERRVGYLPSETLVAP